MCVNSEYDEFGQEICQITGNECDGCSEGEGFEPDDWDLINGYCDPDGCGFYYECDKEKCYWRLDEKERAQWLEENSPNEEYYYRSKPKDDSIKN